MSERADLGYSPAWRRGTEIVLPSLIRAAMKRDWHGQEHIPREGGVIIAPNHLSYADWAAIALFAYQAGRYPAFLIKSPVFDVKLIGPFLRAVGQLPVNRGQIDAALVLKDAERSLRAGECLIVYPEGTATRDPALWPMVARTGVARLALVTGAPVIPVAQWGPQLVLAPYTKRPHFFPIKTMHVWAGPPVDLDDVRDRPVDAVLLHEVTERIMAAVTTLLEEIRGEQAPPERFDPKRQGLPVTGNPRRPRGDD